VFAETAFQALRKKKCLSITHDGTSQIVEVHSLGYSESGALLMRVFQIAGTPVDEVSGWRLLEVEKHWVAEISSNPSFAPRPGYEAKDPEIYRIFAQV
jgi:hypothetical protein